MKAGYAKVRCLPLILIERIEALKVTKRGRGGGRDTCCTVGGRVGGRSYGCAFKSIESFFIHGTRRRTINANFNMRITAAQFRLDALIQRDSPFLAWDCPGHQRICFGKLKRRIQGYSSSLQTDPLLTNGVV